MRFDLTVIQGWIKPRSRVLDLGCGDGALLEMLRDNKQVKGLGVEIEADDITRCIARGINVIEQNLNHSLANFESASFDVVVMTLALQALEKPDQVLDEMLRIGREGIVTFPNFGHWSCRWYIGTRGRMPVSESLPYQWYDTPNIHLCTVNDFEALCAARGYRINHCAVVGADNRPTFASRLFPNLFGVTAVYHISR